MALFLHGNGSASIFYDAEETNAIAASLTAEGIAYFPFNNRGAHYIKQLNRTLPDGSTERTKYGAAYELISECVADINGAVSFLKDRGFTEFYLIGTSTGANKICVFDHLEPSNDFSKYVLVAGADDSGIYYDELGAEAWTAAIEQARSAVESDRGRELIPAGVADAMGLISWQSLLDTLDPDGYYNTFPFNDYINRLGLSERPLFGYYQSITKPHLLLYGADDEYMFGDVERVVEILGQHHHPDAQVASTIIPGADHGFHGKSAELAEAITDFLIR